MTGMPPRKPFANSRTAENRLSGRALQRRNARIALRDGFTCQECGRVTEEGEVDHRIPLAKGGAEDDLNCQWLCAEPCHRNKTVRENGGKTRLAIGPDGFPVSARIAARKPGGHWSK